MTIELLISAVGDTRKDERPTVIAAKGFPVTSQPTRRCVPRPCPSCGSSMVRSRDLRDMCLICGYLQSQA